MCHILKMLKNKKKHNLLSEGIICKKNDIIEALLEGNIQYSKRPSSQNDITEYGLNVYHSRLFTRLSEYLGNSGNNYFFQIKGLNIDKLMRYTDGTYSSIIKGATKIEGKKGFELINPVDIVYDIFDIVKCCFGKQLVQLFDNRINITAEQINYLLNIKEIQAYSKLKAYSLFLKEVYEEINIATKYQKHSLITATNLQKIRIELLKMFNSNVEEIRLNLKSLEVEYKKLFNDYINLRYITEYYIIALIFEYILTERIDDKSIERLKSMINNIKNDYNEASSLFYSTANGRAENIKVDGNNIKNRWKLCIVQCFYDYIVVNKMEKEVENLNNFLMSIDDNETDDEIFAIVDEFINNRKRLLEDIKIMPDVPGDNA